jgi:hypothetical protein
MTNINPRNLHRLAKVLASPQNKSGKYTKKVMANYEIAILNYYGVTDISYCIRLIKKGKFNSHDRLKKGPVKGKFRRSEDTKLKQINTMKNLTESEKRRRSEQSSANVKSTRLAEMDFDPSQLMALSEVINHIKILDVDTIKGKGGARKFLVGNKPLYHSIKHYFNNLTSHVPKVYKTSLVGMIDYLISYERGEDCRCKCGHTLHYNLYAYTFSKIKACCLKSGIVKQNTLEHYQALHGEVEGYEKFLSLKHKPTIQRYLDCYGEAGIDLYNKRIEDARQHMSVIRGQSGQGVSKSSQQLFRILDDLSPNNDFIYHTKSGFESRFVLSEEDVQLSTDVLGRSNISFYLDFTSGNRIIEFDCVAWHNAEVDSVRDLILSKAGYVVLRVWFEDFIKNSGEVVEQCLNFLNNQEKY